ncbi:Odorant receptor [Camponotus japonicus]
MRVLEFTFTILTICGCWTPDSWTSSYKRFLYHIYAIFIFLLISTFTLSQFLDLILIVDNPDDFTDNFYMLLAMIISCCKMSSLLVNRDNIAMLTDVFMKKPCIPIEPDEIEIRRKFDKLIEVNTLHYAILIEFSSSSSVVQSLLTDYWEGKLTFRAWLPFDYSSTILFHFMYFHQLIGLLVGALLHVACDSLICGLILHICCQIEILNYRMQRVIRNPKILRDYVIQHNLMIKFAFMMNKKFRLTITFQFIVSTMVVCVTLYQLTKTNANVIQLGLYMLSMLTQIFLYCWYGNEVKLKSMQLTNNLFEIEWLMLREDVKKDLLTITRCGTVPIEFTSAYIFPMNLDSFVGLLKMSYSTYNILQQMRDESVEGK